MKELGVALVGAGTLGALYLVYNAGKRKGYKQGVCDTLCKMNEAEKWLQGIIIETKCNED